MVARMLAQALDDPSFGESADMDAPGTPKSVPGDRRFGGAEVRRFRRRSTETGYVSPGQQKQLNLLLGVWDTLAKGEKTLHIEQVGQVVKANYVPSAAETALVMKWLDSSQDGMVTFDEYCVAMAGVMTSAGLTAVDVTAAKESMSSDLASVLLPEQEQTPGWD